MIPDQIRELADKYLSGKASPEEVQQLHDWYDTAGNEEAELIFTPEPTTLQQFGSEAFLQLRAAIQQEKQVHADPEVKKRSKVKRLNFWMGLSAAAAVLIAIGFTGYLYFSRPAQDKPVTSTQSIPENEIKPGGNTAVLTLADGRTISLDSLADGKLLQQGSAALSKPGDGQLIYAQADAATNAIVVYNTLSTPNGGQYQLTLPDGTRVWLNAASSLRYPTAFNGAERTVQLSGEGYFEVAPNAAQPFIVSTASGTVTVLGTHFNVNAYTDEQVYRTTLLEGRVQVSAWGNTVTLRPGQQAGIPQQPGALAVSTADLMQAVAWKNGYFAFENTDLKTLMRQIARWYDVEILYESEPADSRFVGEVSRNSNLSEVLKILELSGVHFRIDGKRIIVGR